MAIYTSYFGNMRNLPYNAITISICAKPPEWYNGVRYKKVAPTYNTLMSYKRGGSWEDYIVNYNRETLSKVSQSEVYSDIMNLAGNAGYDGTQDIVLLCYEVGNCHRHLVADWMRGGGYEIEEFGQ